MKHIARLCSHEVIKQWLVDYWETYDPAVNWISVSSQIYISSINELPSKSTEFLFSFLQSDLDLDA